MAELSYRRHRFPPVQKPRLRRDQCGILGHHIDGTAVLEYGSTEILPPVGAKSIHPARLCRPARPVSRAHPRGRPGLSTYEDSASERRIDRDRAWLETRDAAEKVLILGANLNAGNELVAKTRGAAFGWHRLTLAQLAANMASTALTERGLASISQIGAEATVAPLFIVSG